MGDIESRMHLAGLVLPPPPRGPNGVRLPFSMVLRRGNRLLISGHGPQDTSGGFDGMTGKVGDTLSVDQGYQAARQVGLSILGSIQRELGELDRVARWVRVFGMVNSAPGFCDQPAVLNGFSDLILDLYGEVRGAHVRSAVGMAELPFNIAVEIEGEVEVAAA